MQIRAPEAVSFCASGVVSLLTDRRLRIVTIIPMRVSYGRHGRFRMIKSRRLPYSQTRRRRGLDFKLKHENKCVNKIHFFFLCLIEQKIVGKILARHSVYYGILFINSLKVELS